MCICPAHHQRSTGLPSGSLAQGTPLLAGSALLLTHCAASANVTVEGDIAITRVIPEGKALCDELMGSD